MTIEEITRKLIEAVNNRDTRAIKKWAAVFEEKQKEAVNGGA